MTLLNPRYIAAVVLGLVLAGCGGGSSTTAPLDTNQVSMGTVTGFGSVFVNGTEWETDSATFDLDDQPGSESGLKVGQIVLVHGTISSDGTASASSIEYDAEVEGTIASIDVGGDSFVVAGQTITVDADTVFDDSLLTRSLEGLAVGDYVEVSALPTANGYLATRVELEVDDGEIEVTGHVASLDSNTSTFTIDSLVVDYTSAVFEDFGVSTIADGDRVHVHGSGFGANGELLATTVEYKDNPGSDGDEYELEGFITAVNADGSFVVNDVTVTLGANVTYEHGTATSIAVDARVEVEGELDAAGNLVADHIEFKLESTIKVEAPIQSVDYAAGTVTVLGIVFNVTDTTQYDDDSDLDVTFFDLEDMAVGEWVEIRAYVDDATGSVLATRVERDDAEDEVELEGPVDSVNPLVILGVTVDTAAAQLDAESTFASVTDLLAAIVPGTTIVEVDGMQTDTAAITASEIEIED